MTCLRCGRCCVSHWVVVVVDPDRGVDFDNLESKNSGARCRHLRGDTPGEFSCAVHDREWYNTTPCYTHGQIEDSPEDPCRLGKAVMEGRINERSQTAE